MHCRGLGQPPDVFSLHTYSRECELLNLLVLLHRMVCHAVLAEWEA